MSDVVIGKKRRRYGLIPKTDVLVRVPRENEDRVISRLDEYVMGLLDEAKPDPEGPDFDRVMEQMSREIGCYGRYSCVTTRWDSDDKGYLWTFCEVGDEEKTRDILKGSVRGLDFEFFPGDVLMLINYDKRAERTNWKSKPERNVNIVIHTPYGDWRVARHVIKKGDIMGRLSEDGKTHMRSWRALGSYRSLPGSSPQYGKVGELVKDYPYLNIWSSYDSINGREAIRTIIKNARRFELPVITVFDDVYVPILYDTIAHTEGLRTYLFRNMHRRRTAKV